MKEPWPGARMKTRGVGPGRAGEAGVALGTGLGWSRVVRGLLGALGRSEGCWGSEVRGGVWYKYVVGGCTTYYVLVLRSTEAQEA